MILALFIWVLVVILSLSFLFSYLLWSPPSKTPYAFALEVTAVSVQAYFIVVAFTIFLGASLLTLWLVNFLQSF